MDQSTYEVVKFLNSKDGFREKIDVMRKRFERKDSVEFLNQLNKLNIINSVYSLGTNYFELTSKGLDFLISVNMRDNLRKLSLTNQDSARTIADFKDSSEKSSQTATRMTKITIGIAIFTSIIAIIQLVVAILPFLGQISPFCVELLIYTSQSLFHMLIYHMKNKNYLRKSHLSYDK